VPTDVESWTSEPVESTQTEVRPEPDAHTETADVRQQMLALKRKLEDAAADVARVQNTVASVEKLEQLLKQGRTHLQDLRGRLQEMSADRDRLKTEIDDHQIAHQRAVERLQEQIDEAAKQAFLQKTRAEQLVLQLEEREASYQQFADERADERATFERVISEATANQREMVQELDENRQQVETLREAAMRAQSLARQIMRAHEETVPDKKDS